MNAEREASHARPGTPTGASPGPTEGRAAGVPAAPGRLAVAARRRDPGSGCGEREDEDEGHRAGAPTWAYPEAR